VLRRPEQHVRHVRRAPLRPARCGLPRRVLRARRLLHRRHVNRRPVEIGFRRIAAIIERGLAPRHKRDLHKLCILLAW
jgi:hypothetical protein